jgi:hypothetical protein
VKAIIINAAKNTDNFIKTLTDFLNENNCCYDEVNFLIEDIKSIISVYQPSMSSYVVLEYLKEQEK